MIAEVVFRYVTAFRRASIFLRNLLDFSFFTKMCTCARSLIALFRLRSLCDYFLQKRNRIETESPQEIRSNLGLIVATRRI